jgi:hypothetical protein
MASEGKDDKVRKIAEKVWIEGTSQVACDRILREELAGLLEAAGTIRDWAYLPTRFKETLDKLLAEYGWPWRKS